jgi:DNA-binding winged helix-turn-helix (wHTH) protein
MIFRFDTFELDLDRVELRAGGRPVAVEPQVFALLALLVENRDRVVSRDELVDRIWDGRVVTDATVASRIKSARRALGDDGDRQRFVRTVQRRGFRFVAEAVAVPGTRTVAQEAASPGAAVLPARPSIAVLRFDGAGDLGAYGALAEAIPHELIMELSRLRWLFVTARGSSFRLSPGDTPYEAIGRLLGVRYCLGGLLELDGRRLALTVQLVDALDGGVVWGERFSGPLEDVHAMRDAVRAGVLAALEIRIPLHEAERARQIVPDDLDAWSAYHLGVQHVYRFNRRDNAQAAALFARALALDPGFARAHAGLSFVHFQTAFLRFSDEVASEVSAARRHAERAIELDPLDPFTNFTMGRSLWLTGDLDGSLGWLEQSTQISPNYAQGLYARAWTESLAGRVADGRRHVDLAMQLSPLDPLHYAMVATRSFTHTALGEDPDAATWAERAARAPGAHVMIAMIAAAAHELNGDAARARGWAQAVRERNAVLTREDFFRSFPMADAPMRARYSGALARHGF